MKRFWNVAAHAAGEGGYVILLDGTPMRLPGGAALVVASEALAAAIAAEWQAAGGERGGEMSMDNVPLTRLAGTAQERIAPDPAPVVDALARYAQTDVLCYREGEKVALAARQAREWQPWLDWLAATHGARLQATEGIRVLRQDEAALARVRAVLARQTAPVLAGLGLAIPALGSAVLGLALAEGALDAAAAHALATLDERFQEEQWGVDEWARKRRADVAADVALAARFISLSSALPGAHPGVR